MVRGYEAINGDWPLRIGPDDQPVAPARENWRFGFRTVPPSFGGLDSPLAKELGLTLLVLGAAIEIVPGLSRLSEVEVLLAGPHARVCRLRGPRPLRPRELAAQPQRLTNH